VKVVAFLSDEAWHREYPERYMGLDTTAAAPILAQSDPPGELASDQAARIERACHDTGADLVAASPDDDTLLDDVAVPRGRLTDMIAAVAAIARRHRSVNGTFGHAGDGNLHPTLVYDRRDSDEAERASEAFDDIVHAALRLGGTVTGEHGVGVLKRDHLLDEMGHVSIHVQRSIKAALAPHGILNPGEVLEGPEPP
jgi:glycolate oxidase